MKIESRNVSGALDRQILTAMIVDTAFLQEIADIYDPDFIRADYASEIADWCLEYFGERKQAPGRNIQMIYDRHVREKTLSKLADPELIERFLSSLSTEYDKSHGGINTDFLVDEAVRLWQLRNMENLRDDLDDSLKTGNLDAAEEVLHGHKAVERLADDYIDPFRDTDRIIKHMADMGETILHMKGALGEMLNPYLRRGVLLGITAPEKRGKSYLLTTFLRAGIMSQRNVAYFEAGDMTEGQALLRLHGSIAKKPIMETNEKSIFKPVVDCFHNQTGSCDHCSNQYTLLDENETMLPKGNAPMGYKPCTDCMGTDKFEATVFHRKVKRPDLLDESDIVKSSKRVVKWLGKNKQVRFSAHNNGTLTFRKIDAILEKWVKRTGWIPDVIVIDYADIMDSEEKGLDTRERHNVRWMAARQLSQKWHCLVILPTQSDADAYDKESLGMKNFSEDKRKLSHVNGMLVLNQTKEEKENQLIRVGWMPGVLREGAVHWQACCLQCLEIGQFHLDSYRWTPKKLQKS